MTQGAIGPKLVIRDSGSSLVAVADDEEEGELLELADALGALAALLPTNGFGA